MKSSGATSSGAALVALIAAAYGNALHAPLLRDSQFVIGGDPRLRELSWHNLALIFTKSYWWPTYAIPLYRPFTTLTYLVNWTLLGSQGDPLGYHLVNLALHAANAVLLYLLARRLLPGFAFAPWIAAALWAVHPIQTEAVTYVVGRADELVTLAIFGALLCHQRIAGLDGQARRRWLALLAGLACMGAFSKESGLLLLPVLLLHDVLFAWPRLEGPARARLAALGRSCGASYLATLPALVALPIARYFAAIKGAPFLGWPFIDDPLVVASFAVRAMTAMKVFALQVGLLLFPRTLSADYSFDAVPVFGSASAGADALCWLGLALVLLALGFGLALRRRAPAAAFGLLLFLGLLLPTSNLLFPTGSLMAERFLYLPSAGLCLAAAVAIEGTRLAWAPRLPALAVPGVLILALGIRTHLRNADWSDALTLWTATEAAEPRSVRAQAGLASALVSGAPTEANLDLAITHAQRAVEILDAHPLPAEERDASLYTELAHLLRIKGELLRARSEDAQAEASLQSAWDLLQRAAELDASTNLRVQALRRQQGSGSASVEVGNHVIYLELFSTAADLQRWPEATAAAEHARALAPLDPAAHLDLARIRLTEGRLEDAAVETMESLVVEAGNGEAWSQLQTLYSALGEEGAIRRTGAQLGFNAAIPLVRGHLNRACGELIALLVAGGSTESARVLYQRATDPSDLAVPPEALAAPP